MTKTLTAPPHLRGKMPQYGHDDRRRERLAWVRSVPPGVTLEKIGEALGVTTTTAGKLSRLSGRTEHLREYRPRWSRGIKPGRMTSAVGVLDNAAWDALEERCLRTGTPVAEALVAHWAETYNAGGNYHGR